MASSLSPRQPATSSREQRLGSSWQGCNKAPCGSSRATRTQRPVPYCDVLVGGENGESRSYWIPFDTFYVERSSLLQCLQLLDLLLQFEPPPGVVLGLERGSERVEFRLAQGFALLPSVLGSVSVAAPSFGRIEESLLLRKSQSFPRNVPIGHGHVSKRLCEATGRPNAGKRDSRVKSGEFLP